MAVAIIIAGGSGSRMGQDIIKRKTLMTFRSSTLENLYSI